jgi:GTP-binding protein
MELKLLADVGLVGMPSVGKSSLIARFSAARPKVADYHFTTLVPNLGVVQISSDRSFVMADIPGLVRGASQGAGLGHRFLKHVQRTAVLLHVVAPDPTGENDLLDDFDALVDEVTAYSQDLAQRPCLVALNKADLPAAREAEPALRAALEARGVELVMCSAATGEGLDALRMAMARKLEDRDRAAEAAEPEDGDQ